MKSNNHTKILISSLFFIVFGSACNEENDEVTLKDVIDFNLINKWELVKVSKIEKLPSHIYDSIKCIDGTPYIFNDGIKSKYVSETDQPDSIINFQPLNDIWTIYSGDSLLIEREGFQPISPVCNQGEIIWMTSPGFPVYNFKMKWEATSESFSILNDNLESVNFQIDYIDKDSLVLEMPNNKLTFQRQKN
ncbi:hypothetical protein [Flammeovirga sp. SJP92]|uniref:hypothetical protein n=1 Tax=Flammeovirga sp. SJP92 TaxID=1775430 RepID=UPI00078867BC|nr:hypothetical protein [Flammeovirga sp. SJP92]KXX70869.1 hypothetical protein AVL50_10880 [Flammeovirga sp. SJP92]